MSGGNPSAGLTSVANKEKDIFMRRYQLMRAGRALISLAALVTMITIAAGVGVPPTGAATTNPYSTPTTESPLPEPQTAPTTGVVHGYTAWHNLGFKGQEVKVMVIDAGWEGLGDEIVGTDANPRTVVAHCFNRALGLGVPGTIGNTPAHCEGNNRSEDQDHGTEVALALLEAAPLVSLYVSNAQYREEVASVVEWLTRDVNNPRVDIIVHSVDLGWEGPGDGTATVSHPYENPIIKSVEKATTAGILWVSPTGNNGEKTWFSRSLSFNAENRLDMNTPEIQKAGRCLPLHGTASKTSLEFLLRWGDNWPTDADTTAPETDLSLAVTTNSVERIEDGVQVHTGTTTYPLESFSFSGLPAGGHLKCVSVIKSGTTPDWIQLLSNDAEIIDGRGLQGSLIHVAEIADPHHLAVGTTNPNGMQVAWISGRGPVPIAERRGDVAGVDVVAIGTNPSGGNPGTSFAAPRAAGLAAIARQIRNSAGKTTDAATIVRLMRGMAKSPPATPQPRAVALPPSQRCQDIAWGCGLAYLPPPSEARVRLSTTGQNANSVEITISPATAQVIGGNFPYHKVTLYERNSTRTATTVIGTTITVDTETGQSFETSIATTTGGKTFYAEVEACLNDTDDASCILTTESDDHEFSLAIPTNVQATAAIDSTTISWDAVTDATEYEVEQSGSIETFLTSTTSETVEMLTPSETYQFRVRAIAGDAASPWSKPATTTLPTLPVPTGLRVFQLTAGRIDFLWTTVIEATSYEVRLDGGEPQDTINHFLQTKGLTPEQTYRFEVRSVRGEHRSAWSAPLEATTGALQATNTFRATREIESVRLNWSYVAGATDYEIEQIGVPQTTTSMGETTVTITGLTPGVTVSFRVRPTHGTLVGPWSETVTSSALGNSPPINIRAIHLPCQTFGGMVRAEFDHPEDDNHSINFRIDVRQANPDARNFRINQPVADSTGTVHMPRRLDRGAYELTVQTCESRTGGDCSKPSDPPVVFSVTEHICTPYDLIATPGDGKVVLKWRPEPDATSFQVRVDEGDPTDVPGNADHHVVRELDNGTSYSFQVRTLGTGGPSEWSSAVTTTPTADPTEPISPGDVRNLWNGNRPHLTRALQWTTNSGSPIYQIRLWDGLNDKWVRLPAESKGWHEEYRAHFTQRGMRTQALFTGLIPGTTYAVQVWGTRDDGSKDGADHGAWSEVTTLTTRGTRPANLDEPSQPVEKMPPSNLTGTANGRSVTLNWTAHTNPNYTNQYVWRREAGVTPIDWTEIPIGLNDTSYTDTTMPGESEYVYRIRAEKANGKGGVSNAITLWVD